MARSSKTEQELIIGLGILRENKVQAAFSHLAENFQGWLVDVAANTPAHHSWFSKCWDQVIFVVLVHKNVKFIFAAHECVGRGHARTTLLQLRDELGTSLSQTAASGAQVLKIEKKLKTIACSMKGVVPSRKVLILYEGAPKKFLTKEEQAPELIEQGKSRLFKELEDFDRDEEGFVFSLDKSKTEGSKPGGGEEDEEDDEDDFVFNIPAKDQPQQQTVAQQKIVPQSAIFPTPHMRNNPPRPPVKKAQSPGISNDFTWNGSRVSPDDKEATAKPSASPLAAALHTGFHNLGFRGGKNIFSAQFEKNGSGRQQQPHDGKVRGQVGQIAPSGLRWEDEIAAQLAAAGVKVSSAEGEGDEEDKSPTASGRLTAAEWRSGSLSRQPERGKGLSRISRGLRRAFNRNGDDVAS